MYECMNAISVDAPNRDDAPSWLMRYMKIELHTCVKNDTCVRNEMYMKNKHYVYRKNERCVYIKNEYIYVTNDPVIDIYEDERHVYVTNDPGIYQFKNNTPYERMNHMIWLMDCCSQQYDGTLHMVPHLHSD